ncbi:hypothetical protein [Streptomyces sp. NPDC001478]
MGKDESSIPDEEWERFLREAEAGSAGAPEEPSARARMVTRRLADEPDPPEGWRTHRPPARTKGRTWYVVGFVVVLALLVVALMPGTVAGWFDGRSGDSVSHGGPTGEPATSGSSARSAEPPTVDDPFKGSPAAGWEDGVSSLTLPEARATGWMDKAQVARALARSRDFLAATNTDPGVLRGERPAKALALLNPHQKDVQGYVKAALSAPSVDNDPLHLFSRFDPARFRVVDDVVRTLGRITYREGKGGALDVTADVTYVYPVVRADDDSDEVARTVVRRETVMSWEDPSKVQIEPDTFSLIVFRTDAANGGCANRTGFYVPEFAADRQARDGSLEGAPKDPYERDTSMAERVPKDGGDRCGRVTRL